MITERLLADVAILKEQLQAKDKEIEGFIKDLEEVADDYEKLAISSREKLKVAVGAIEKYLKEYGSLPIFNNALEEIALLEKDKV